MVSETIDDYFTRWLASKKNRIGHKSFLRYSHLIDPEMDRAPGLTISVKGYDPICGARPMRRAVEKYLEDPLAEEPLRGNIKQGNTLEVHAAGEQLAFKVTWPEQQEPANGRPLRSLS